MCLAERFNEIGVNTIYFGLIVLCAFTVIVRHFVVIPCDWKEIFVIDKHNVLNKASKLRFLLIGTFSKRILICNTGYIEVEGICR